MSDANPDLSVCSKRYSLQAGQTKTLSIKLPKGIRKFAKKAPCPCVRSAPAGTLRATSPRAPRSSA